IILHLPVAGADADTAAWILAETGAAGPDGVANDPVSD
ncbi:MAG: divalent-cation tolerance protein CutA, partial [Actinomycetospora chiangmaiensis]|nr:divalent-cation tolerance protein CutA [Actinomycetospora chiangmaiensis]